MPAVSPRDAVLALVAQLADDASLDDILSELIDLKHAESASDVPVDNDPDIRNITLSFPQTRPFQVALLPDDEREYTSFEIDGVSYHFERLRKESLLSDYRVDSDPDFVPRTDPEGFCCIIAPYPDDGTSKP